MGKIILGAAIIGTVIYNSPTISRIILNGKQPSNTMLMVAVIGAGAYAGAKVLRLA